MSESRSGLSDLLDDYAERNTALFLLLGLLAQAEKLEEEAAAARNIAQKFEEEAALVRQLEEEPNLFDTPGIINLQIAVRQLDARLRKLEPKKQLKKEPLPPEKAKEERR